jgi:hypothetical protein
LIVGNDIINGLRNPLLFDCRPIPLELPLVLDQFVDSLLQLWESGVEVLPELVPDVIQEYPAGVGDVVAVSDGVPVLPVLKEPAADRREVPNVPGNLACELAKGGYPVWMTCIAGGGSLL